MRLVVEKGGLMGVWDNVREYVAFMPQIKNLDESEPEPEEDILHLCTNVVSVPLPYRHASFNIKADGDHFSYGFTLTARRSRDFTRAGKMLSRILPKQKMRFYPTSRRLTGYVLNPDDEIEAEIFEGCDESAREISIGMHGSKQRRYESFSELRADVLFLEGVLETILRNTTKPNPLFQEALPDTNIYLCFNI